MGFFSALPILYVCILNCLQRHCTFTCKTYVCVFTLRSGVIIHSCVSVCVCMHLAVWWFIFFLTGILSMNSSDWIKYHNTHQDRFRQSDYLFLCHHFFLFQQQKASKDSLRHRIPWKRHDIHTFSITFCKSEPFIIVQSTNVVLQIRIWPVYSQGFWFFGVKKWLIKIL